MKTLLVAVTCLIIAAHDFGVCIDRKFKFSDEAEDTEKSSEESSEDDHPKTYSITVNELARNSETVGEPAQSDSFPDSSSESSVLRSTEDDELSVRRRSNESINVDSRSLPCHDSNDETGDSFSTRVAAPQSIESARSSFVGLGPITFSRPSMSNASETCHLLGSDNLNLQTSENIGDLNSDTDFTNDFLISQTSESNEPFRIPDNSRNSSASGIFQPQSNEENAGTTYSSLERRIIGNDLTTAAEMSASSSTTSRFVEIFSTTSNSLDTQLQNSLQIQQNSIELLNANTSEVQSHLQSHNVTSNFDPNYSEPGIRSISLPLVSEDSRNRAIHLLQQISDPSSLLLSNLPRNSNFGPLPYHWQTGTERDFYSVSLPLNSSTRPLLHYWSTRSHFSCGLEAKIGKNISALCNCIFSSLKEIIQTSSETRVGAVDTESVGTNSIDGIRFSEDLSSDIDYLRVTLEEIARQFETESTARSSLLLRPTSVRHLISEVEITLAEIIQHLPPSPISFRVAAEVLVSRALRRICTQRRYIQSAADKYRRGSFGGTAEDSFSGIRRVIGIIMEDLAFILALALPVLEQFDMGN